MNLFNIPGMDGIKSAVAGWGLLIVGLGKLLTVIGGCLTGDLDLQTCMVQLAAAWDGLLAAFMGLGILGIGHKIEKSKS